MFATDNPKLKSLKLESEFSWQRIDIYYAGAFDGFSKYFLAVVNSYIKWLDVQVKSNTLIKCNLPKIQVPY